MAGWLITPSKFEETDVAWGNRWKNGRTRVWAPAISVGVASTAVGVAVGSSEGWGQGILVGLGVPTAIAAFAALKRSPEAKDGSDPAE
jgi:hypothetical protein